MSRRRAMSSDSFSKSLARSRAYGSSKRRMRSNAPRDARASFSSHAASCSAKRRLPSVGSEEPVCSLGMSGLQSCSPFGEFGRNASLRHDPVALVALHHILDVGKHVRVVREDDEACRPCAHGVVLLMRPATSVHARGVGVQGTRPSPCAVGGSRAADDPRRAPHYVRSSFLSRWALPLFARPRLTM
jgi:hypothetical protein